MTRWLLNGKVKNFQREKNKEGLKGNKRNNINWPELGDKGTRKVNFDVDKKQKREFRRSVE